MSETTSAKEMDDKERFRPSDRELEEYMDDFNADHPFASYFNVMEAGDEWIEAETERRMTADYADKLPFRRGKK